MSCIFRLVETDVELGRSRRILKKMYLNVFTNKIVLILIIVIEICIDKVLRPVLWGGWRSAPQRILGPILAGSC